MKFAAYSRELCRYLGCSAALLSTVFNLMLPPGLSAQTDPNSIPTTSPIKHVIVIIGENRSFDHVYATYKPKNGEKVFNLLSEGIIKANGSRGPNYSLSAQFSAVDTNGEFAVSPQGKSIYGNIPLPSATDRSLQAIHLPLPSKPRKLPNSPSLIFRKAIMTSSPRAQQEFLPARWILASTM